MRSNGSQLAKLAAIPALNVRQYRRARKAHKLRQPKIKAVSFGMPTLEIEPRERIIYQLGSTIRGCQHTMIDGFRLIICLLLKIRGGIGGELAQAPGVFHRQPAAQLQAGGLMHIPALALKRLDHGQGGQRGEGVVADGLLGQQGGQDVAVEPMRNGGGFDQRAQLRAARLQHDVQRGQGERLRVALRGG